MENFYIPRADVLNLPSFTTTLDLVVFGYLVTAANGEEKSVTVSLNELAKRLRTSRRVLTTVMQRLDKAGLVSLKSFTSEFKPTYYIHSTDSFI